MLGWLCGARTDRSIPAVATAHQGELKAEVVIWYGELGQRILPLCTLPNPTPAGDKPLASRSLRPHYISASPPRWIAACAGMTLGGPERRVGEPWYTGTTEAA